MELYVCGKQIPDFNMLKRHTEYHGEYNENHPLIKWFWKILFSMTDAEKLRFVKFCWGQERLPATDDQFEITQTRFMIKQYIQDSGNSDEWFPKADTCFFNLLLPNYSKAEVIEDKLLKAIYWDVDSMNAEDIENELEGFVVNDRDRSGDNLDRDMSDDDMSY